LNSKRICKELEKLFPGQCKTVKVKMKYVKEVDDFIKKVEDAHKRTAKSKQKFKKCAICDRKHSPACKPLMGRSNASK
jgi:hypothetical protein